MGYYRPTRPRPFDPLLAAAALLLMAAAVVLSWYRF